MTKTASVVELEDPDVVAALKARENLSSLRDSVDRELQEIAQERKVIDISDDKAFEVLRKREETARSRSDLLNERIPAADAKIVAASEAADARRADRHLAELNEWHESNKKRFIALANDLTNALASLQALQTESIDRVARARALFPNSTQTLRTLEERVRHVPPRLEDEIVSEEHRRLWAAPNGDIPLSDEVVAQIVGHGNHGRRVDPRGMNNYDVEKKLFRILTVRPRRSTIAPPSYMGISLPPLYPDTTRDDALVTRILLVPERDAQPARATRERDPVPAHVDLPGVRAGRA